MKEQKVEEYPDLRKVDNCFIVNTNRKEYLKSLGRLKKQKEDIVLKNKVDEIESKLDLILKLLGKEVK